MTDQRVVVGAVSTTPAPVASAPPVGPLPPGQVTNVSTPPDSLIAIALSGKTASSGLVWRLARGG